MESWTLKEEQDKNAVVERLVEANTFLTQENELFKSYFHRHGEEGVADIKAQPGKGKKEAPLQTKYVDRRVDALGTRLGSLGPRTGHSGVSTEQPGVVRLPRAAPSCAGSTISSFRCQELRRRVSAHTLSSFHELLVDHRCCERKHI